MSSPPQRLLRITTTWCSRPGPVIPPPLLDWLSQNRARLDAGQHADWLQVANWADDDRQVVAVWEELPASVRNGLPERGLLAVARSYRNLQQWQEARLLWEQILRRNPDQQDARAGWIMSLADAAAHAQAREQAELFNQQHSNYLSHQVLAYVLRGHGNEWERLFAVIRLREAPGGQGDAADRMVADALAAGRGSTPASARGGRLPPEPRALRRVAVDQAAAEVRLAHARSRGGGGPDRIADQPIA